MNQGGVLSPTSLWTALVLLLLGPAAVRQAHSLHFPHDPAAEKPRGASDTGIVGNKLGNSETEQVTPELSHGHRASSRHPDGGAHKESSHERDQEGSILFPLSSNWGPPVHILESRDEHGGGPWPTGNYTAVEGELSEGDENSQQEDNCTHPRQPMPRYNDSCNFVHAECKDKSELIDYLAFVLCDLPKAQVLHSYMAISMLHRQGTQNKGERLGRQL